MNRVKLILSYLFGFITSVLLSIIVILIILKFVVLDKENIKNVLVKNNYYNEVYKGTLEEMQNYMVSSGLEENILDDIFSENDIKTEINNYIDSIYSQTKYSVNSDKVKERLTNNINNYLSSNNLDVTNRNELDLFIKDMINIYENQITFYKAFNYVTGIINKVLNNFDRLIDLTYILTVIVIIIMYLVRNMFISSSILSGGFILLFTRFMIYEKIDIDNIMIISEYFSESFKYILYRIGHYLLLGSVLLIALGLIILIIESLGKKKIRN